MNKPQEEMKELIAIAVDEYGMDNIEDGVAQFGFTVHRKDGKIIISGEVFGEKISVNLLDRQ